MMLRRCLLLFLALPSLGACAGLAAPGAERSKGFPVLLTQTELDSLIATTDADAATMERMRVAPASVQHAPGQALTDAERDRLAAFLTGG